MAQNSNIAERFVCQECKAIFSSNGHLSRHMESQHYEEFANISLQNISQNASSTFVMVNGKRRPLCDLCNKVRIFFHIESSNNKLINNYFNYF